jgi:hypothetical protein
MAEPFAAFPSWFLRVECDRCGKVRMVNEKRIIAGDLPSWARARRQSLSAHPIRSGRLIRGGQQGNSPF